MGSGKGNVEYWVAVIKNGKIILELKGLNKINSKLTLKTASYKLPIKTKIINQNITFVNRKALIKKNLK